MPRGSDSFALQHAHARMYVCRRDARTDMRAFCKAYCIKKDRPIRPVSIVFILCPLQFYHCQFW